MRITIEQLYHMTLSEIEDAYRADLQINRNRLEEAAFEQAERFSMWYTLSERVTADLRDAEYLLTRARARWELKVRQQHPSYKEGAIKAKLETVLEIIKLNQEINKLKSIAGMLKGAIESGRQRKSMVGRLCELYRDNYWNKTTPKGTPLRRRRVE